jgi:hypothetical protein
MKKEDLIGKEFYYTTWGMTRTSGHGSIDKKWKIQKVDGNYCKCMLVWSEQWESKNKDLYQPSFQNFLISEVKDRLV